MLDISPPEAQYRVLHTELKLLIEGQRQKPTDETERLLRAVRAELVGLWRRIPADAIPAALAGPLGDCHEALMGSGLRELPMSDDERDVLSLLADMLAAGWGIDHAPASLLGASLFVPAYKLDLSLDVAAAPAAFRASILAYLFELPALFIEPGDADLYVTHAVRLVDWVHDEVLAWKDQKRVAEVIEAFLRSPFWIQACFTEEALPAAARKRAAIIQHHLRASGAALEHKFAARPAGGRIKLGVVVPHLGPQTETYFTLAHYEHLDRERFAVTLFAMNGSTHPLAAHCASRADEVVPLPGHDVGACAERIRAADLDILLVGSNVSSLTGNITQLAAHRLARVQMAMVLCPITTGMKSMDYFLSPALNETADADAHYTEKLLRVPGWSNCFAYAQDRDPVTTRFDRARLGIAPDAVVFASGASYFKIQPELDETWATILAAVPGSVLVIYPFNPNWADAYQSAPLVRRMQRRFAALGVSAERLIVQPTLPARADIHALLEIADVYLDSFPYAGSCSLVDPLTVGCPIVARDGNVQRARQSSALLRMEGLGDLIAPNDEEYVRLAVQLARDPGQRDQIRRRMRGEAAARTLRCLDTVAYGRAVGEVLADVYEKDVAGAAANKA